MFNIFLNINKSNENTKNGNKLILSGAGEVKA